jgi:tetratricopeptide (TPR) repeat protein
MSKEESEELLEPVVELLVQVDQLIKKGEFEKAIEIIDGREKKNEIDELRWKVVESSYWNEKGEYKQVIEITEEIQKKIKEIGELSETAKKERKQAIKRIRIDALSEQVIALIWEGSFEEGLEKVEEGIRLTEELEELEELNEVDKRKDTERKAKLFNAKGRIYWLKSELDKALEFYEKGLVLSKAVGNKHLIALSLNNIGTYYYSSDDISSALEYYTKSLEIKEELGNKQEIAASLNNIGVIYAIKGELNKSLEFHKKSLKTREKVGNKRLIGMSLVNIGYIYFQKGELDLAMEKLRLSLQLTGGESDNQSIVTIINIGFVYQELGELEAALEQYKQALKLNKEMDHKINIACNLFYMICVSIDMEELEQAKSYLKELQQISNQEESKLTNLNSRLAEALILKTSKRRKNLTKAEEILEKIVEETEEVLDPQLIVIALINLSELLLKELRATGDEDILEEVEETVKKLSEIAKKQQSHTILVESYWLKAQLALVRLDLIEARNLLTQAQTIAEEKGLERLAHKISNEHDQLLEQLDQWEELIAKDASITERVKVANLEELVGWMARKREIKVDEKEDEPIMLLLVAESGIPIYSKKFDQKKELQDMLISGFLTSINNFVQEAFEVKGVIKRIMHEEYTISFDLIETILFCYVYEGQSYTAMKKLETLITGVQESEMWSALEKVGRTGRGLKMADKEQMEEVIQEIFVIN